MAEAMVLLLVNVMGGVASHYIIKWLDKYAE